MRLLFCESLNLLIRFEGFGEMENNVQQVLSVLNSSSSQMGIEQSDTRKIQRF